MFILFFYFILVNINTYFVKGYFINKIIIINFENEINKDQTIYKKNNGKDERNINKEKIDNKVLENIYKKKIFDKLTDKQISEYEKIEIINSFWEFPQTFNTQNITTLKIKMGGLEDDWNFEDF